MGVNGNEIADWLAKESSKDAITIELKTPINDLKYQFKKTVRERTARKVEAEGRNKGIFYFEKFYDKTSNHSWFDEVRQDRFFMSTVNRSRANHYNLNESLARKGYIESASCECGAEVENVNHVVFDCARYDEERVELRRGLKYCKIRGPLCVWNLIKEKKWKAVEQICKFFKRFKKFI